MFAARTIFEEIFDNDEAFGLFCSIASGEGQGGCENGRIAALLPRLVGHPGAPVTARTAWVGRTGFS